VVIDGRNLSLQELLLALRDALKMQPGQEVSIELLVDKGCDIRKVKAFLRMSGCQTEIAARDGGSVVRITGGCCSCR
jgi:TusA-related sulfurtransferase